MKPQLLWAALVAVASLLAPQDERAASRPASPPPSADVQDGKPLGPGYRWRGPVRPTAANEVFATGDGCSMCHSAAPGANAMRTPLGDDVSPHGLWKATLMANAFRDPYFRAQLARESAGTPEHAATVEGLCLRCHAPMAHHTARLGGQPLPDVAALAHDPLAMDGVSCTVCHQIKPEGLGSKATFNGRPSIGREREIYGPYADPALGPMRMHSGYTPTHGGHIRSAALCGSCHTLFTGHTGGAFPEQTPYLEWRNSAYSDENGRTDASRTCQQCHFPRQAPTKIARNPMGRDFNIATREDYGAHAIVGGNAFMLDLLRRGAKELGVTAPDEAFARLAAAARKQLAEDTAGLEISPLRRKDGRLGFDVTVRNRTGHKFPTGYPSRRAWLRVVVRAGDDVLFQSGGFDEKGRLAKVADERALPHFDRVTAAEQVVVYECVPVDGEGKPTTALTKMARMGKDNRLLPVGWKKDGPDAATTAPVGVDGDPDFAAGGDVVHYDLPVAGDGESLTVVAWLYYQPIPPSWAADLRGLELPAAKTFVGLYDAADMAPDVAALAVRTE